METGRVGATPPGPIRHGHHPHKLPPNFDWSTGLMGCFSHPKICMRGLFCPCDLYGRNVANIGAGSDTTKVNCCTHCCLGSWYACPLHFVLGPLAYWLTCDPCLGARQRYRLRQRYGLKQQPPCSDFCTHCWCHPCALCQEARQIVLGPPAGNGLPESFAPSEMVVDSTFTVGQTGLVQSSQAAGMQGPGGVPGTVPGQATRPGAGNQGPAGPTHGSGYGRWVADTAQYAGQQGPVAAPPDQQRMVG